MPGCWHNHLAIVLPSELAVSRIVGVGHEAVQTVDGRDQVVFKAQMAIRQEKQVMGKLIVPANATMHRRCLPCFRQTDPKSAPSKSDHSGRRR